MTETPPAAPVGKSKKAYVAAVILGLIIGAVAGVAVLCYGRQPDIAPVQPGIVDLQKRVDVLETRLKSLTEITAVMPQETSNDPALADSVKNMQAQIDALQKGDQQAAQKLVAQAMAFWDVRLAARQGEDFSAPLAFLRRTTKDDATMTALIDRLEPYAAHAVPTLPQLRDGLTAAGASIAPIESGQTSWVARIENIMRPLIAVHPAHDDRLASLEQALADNDGAAAERAFSALPDATQKALAAWHEKLTARIKVDEALRAFDAALMPSEGAP